MTAVSLFAGIGGFDLALERLGHEILWANEFNKYAADIYDYHFSRRVDRRDITTIPATDIPDHDLLVCGFPCQAFSVAGKRRGFDDTRGTLFFDIARILNEKLPRYLLLENVKGLLSHDNGRTFQTIITTLDELGYDLQWQVCNSKDFGVPQNRERVFIVGHLRGTARPEVFPLGSSDGAPVEAGAEQPLSGTLSTKNQSPQCQFDGSTTLIGTINRGEFKPTGDRSLTITATYWKGHDNHGSRPMVLDVSYPNREPRIYTDVAPTIRDYGSGGNKMPMVTDQLRIRRLTPTECERLQGFPDGWTAEGVNGPISDTQRYKCLGNAVTVNVVEAIVAHLQTGI